MMWLADNVHSRGSQLTSRELVVAATGRPLDAEIFQNHLKRRYLS
jgi:carboxypeptidase Taq